MFARTFSFLSRYYIAYIAWHTLGRSLDAHTKSPHQSPNPLSPSSPGLLNKSALHSDGKFTKPAYDLQGHPKKIHDAAAIAAVFPPIVKPTLGIATEETEESVGEAATSGLDSDELKRQQRLEQNKMSARRSRRRKKIILEELQTTVDQLTAENEQLEEENKRLEEELERRKKAAAEKGGAGRVVSTATSTCPSTVRPSFGGGISAGTSRMTTATVGPTATPIGVAAPSANRSLLVSQLATIMNGQAAPGLRPQMACAGMAGPGLTATSIISSIATPAPRPSQLYLSRPMATASTNNASQAAAAQEQLHRSILSMYQEQERKNANKKMRLGV